MTSPLEGARIVLGVTGGIAAYKAVEVCRRLVDAGAHVSPVLTKGSLRFVGETTFSALASEPVRTSLWEEPEPIPHTRLGQSADLVIVAPATCRLLGTYVAGISNDLLTATLLATRAPVLVAPAMHTEMWEHAAVQENLATLQRRGVHVVGPEGGRLAGGDVGHGRLSEPAKIVAAAERILGPGDLTGLRVLVTAGGTREPIDPVRYIGNRSSGKQGYALAAEAVARGASVVLATTVDREAPVGVDEVERVDTAQELHDVVTKHAPTCDVVVMAAAVADFRPASVADSKIKKAGGAPEVVLEPTPDILAALGAAKPEGQTLVGFAAETDDLAGNARSKLERKRLDLIVANDVSVDGVGFAHDTNAVTISDAAGGATEVALADKREIARAVFDSIAAWRN
ncbi:MAG: bifunctional phosphopantothenoylcysteine decarboxylase/phosphopantothenate--cysteine ligase CoaBC [Actinomycetota bacterium]